MAEENVDDVNVVGLNRTILRMEEPDDGRPGNAKARAVLVEEIREKWEKEQLEMRKRQILHDAEEWAVQRAAQTVHSNSMTSSVTPLRLIGGVDISFVKGEDTWAAAAFVVCQLPELDVVHSDVSLVQLTEPYIAGYLAFREAPHLARKVEHLRRHQPHLCPQVIIVDGNGVLHPRRMGLAAHLGVMLDLPCVGAAKALFHVDGLEKNADHRERIRTELTRAGDHMLLHSNGGELLGAALRASEQAPNPIYVSVGHKLTLETALWVTRLCCQYRVPEPVRQADLRSREYLRDASVLEEIERRKQQPPQPDVQ